VRIIETIRLGIPDIKVIRYARFCDERGYFTETSRRSDLLNNTATQYLREVEFVQTNESFSRPGTIRGLHFQWNPHMGKLVRTMQGHMVDMALDIRKGSPTFGKIVLYDMPSRPDADFGEWIWVPPGFAHGNFFTENTIIEYFCSGEYSPGCEGCISPIAEDIDWSLSDQDLKRLFDGILADRHFMTEKDRTSLSISGWVQDRRSDNFIYGEL
jgi:dTDP-4-dehydrorhamnose 3,5-epimerase